VPLYEFRCEDCGRLTEALRPMGDHRDSMCSCGGTAVWVISAPRMHTWDTDRPFPNVTSAGDGSMTFDTKEDYEVHLKENHIAESSTDAPVKTPHGTTVTKYGTTTPQS
jgi:putative FmdB family regulatory protein